MGPDAPLKRVRLDQALLLQGLVPSRERGQALIQAGLVRVAGSVGERPDQLVSPDVALEVQGNRRYVSRGGDKLAAAVEAFAFDPTGRYGLDVGASTGGFTDVLLRKGAAGVVAVDVGYGQLAWPLRQDPRVLVLERVNIRDLVQVPHRVDFAVIDVAFISLRLVIPPVNALLDPPGEIIALVKPQFEVGKGEVGKGGIVRRPEQHEEVLSRLRSFASELGYQVAGEVPSPILGARGNREFFLYLRHRA
jgi:23S rRNA (cytidine1920-2'-O)/16S rRNA (cytidine1409-2'-O)-methyltransferase